MLTAFRHFRDYGPAYLVGLGVSFLIATDLLRATGLRWVDLAELVKQFVPVSGRQEIRNYVEFTTVPAGPLSVTTGIRFASSIEEGRITFQWCYVAQENRASASSLHLFLGQGEGSKPPQLADFNFSDLEPFGLDRDAAQALFHTHCRFR